MSDVREIYELVTNQSPPRPGALDRQRRRQVRRVRNRRLAAIGGVAAIAVLLAALMFVAGEVPHATPGDTPAPSLTSPLRAISHLFLDLRTGTFRSLPDSLAGEGLFYTVSPDGTRLAYNSCCSGPDHGFVASMDGTEIAMVTPAGIDAYGVRWSPDGTKLVFQGRDATTMEVGDIFVVDLETGQTTRVTDLPRIDTNGYWFASPSFGPDGDSVVYSLPTQTGQGTEWNTWSQPIDGGKRSLLLPNASYARYSPDGTQVVFLHGPETLSSNELWVADADGTNPHPLMSNYELSYPTWSPDGSRIAFEMRDPSAAEPTPMSSVYVLDVQTGEATKVAQGWDAGALAIGGAAVPEWFDDHTLIVGPSFISGQPSAVAEESP
jgi:Tol biopolymer transport system component